jgi:hypothetical protein
MSSVARVLILPLLVHGVLAQHSATASPGPRGDWLLGRAAAPARIIAGPARRDIVLTNGLVSRTFRLTPNAATVGLDNLVSGETMLRAVSPEAELQLDDVTYPVGGLTGQPDGAFLRRAWLDQLQGIAGAFTFTRFERGTPPAPFAWRRARPAPPAAWPAPGAALTLEFAAPPGPHAGVTVSVHHELYDNAPLFSKWLVIHNGSTHPVRVRRITTEILRAVEGESQVDRPPEWLLPNLTVASDYAFGGGSLTLANRVVSWLPDTTYRTQVNYDLGTPALLVVRPARGPDVIVAPGDSLVSFRTFELLHDSRDRERHDLGVRKMYRILAPWVTENPIMMHVVSTVPETVKATIDQAAKAGFEMVILSFGSGLNMEDTSAANLARFRALREYATAKGIELGGYSLLASRSISADDDVINPATGRTGGAIFGSSPCLGSKWGISYFDRMQRFLDATGFSVLEHDGSYPGDFCASTTHPGHRGLDDSQWMQYQRIAAFYQWCRARGIYLNVPDHYYFAGSNKSGMGYRETNWSLPRALQLIHGRQNLYDGTWQKTPSMGWMFVPLVQYQGGGAAATIEPLRDHLDDYRAHLTNNFGFGAQAAYRGTRLWDAPETEAVVTTAVAWFRKYRDILESDVIHVRRADGQHLDLIVHVNPALSRKAMAVIWNPADSAVTETVTLPLYYAGVVARASVAEQDRAPRVVMLDRASQARITVHVPSGGMTWLVIR